MQNLYFDEQKIERESITPQPGFLESLSIMDKIPAALGFGCLMGLSSPGFDMWWLAWIGLAPLMVLLRSCKTKLEAALIGLIFGMGYELVALNWLLGLFPLRWMGLQDWLGFQAAAVVWLVQSFHQALLFALFALLVFSLPMRAGFLPGNNRPFVPYLLGVPLIWIFFQWVLGTSEIFLGVPVNQLAYSQYHQLFLIQIAKLGGSQLIEFIIVSFNLAVASLIIDNCKLVAKLPERIGTLNTFSGSMFDLTVLAAMLLFIISWGKLEVSSIADHTNLCASVNLTDQAPTVPIALIQGNISIEDERMHSLTPQEISQRYTTLSQSLGVPLLVFPEGVVNGSQSETGLLKDKLQKIAESEKKEVLVGTTAESRWGLVNAVALLSPNLKDQTLYIKRRLVPFGEFLPRNFLSNLIPDAIKKLMVGENEGFIESTQLEVLSSVFGKIGTSICVEVIYPKLISAEVRKGASLLVNVSNLAWFHNSMLNKQVLAAACLRAVENGRYLVLSTNTGVSAVIDPSGAISGMSLAGRPGIIVDTVQFLYRKTPFTKMWWL